MVNKVVVSLISIILVVGAVIGAVVIVKHNKGDTKSGTTSVATSSKAVTNICSLTNYKDTCVNSLSSVGKNESATPMDYIMAAVQATIEEAKKSFQVSQSVKVDASKDPRQAMAVDDCKELLQYAIEDLQSSFSMVGDTDLHSLDDRVFEIINWFAMVVSYQQTCLDQLEVPEYKSVIENGMLNATQLTSNAINILAQIGDALKAFNINLDMFKPTKPTTGSRRLLQAIEVGHDGYPTWFPAADRKLLQAAGGVTPNAVVAKDGSGQYKTISEAVAAIPKKRQGRWIIYVKAGIYNEQVIIPKPVADVLMYGDGPTRTIVTGSKNYKAGVTTMETATFSAVGPRFIAKSMGFQNTAGTKGHQAVAFRSQSDASAFLDCRFEAYQDTLYYHGGRQFYRNCYISGTIDFIFGKGAALIQNSEIVVRMPEPNQFNTVTADGNYEQFGGQGLVLQNCRIVAEPQLFPNRFTIKSYLGRPWDKFSRTAVIQSDIGDLIQPEGWKIWDGKTNHETALYVEYANKGPGAAPGKRVNWKNFRVLTDPKDAIPWTAGIFLEHGKNPGKWLADTGVPYQDGL